MKDPLILIGTSQKFLLGYKLLNIEKDALSSELIFAQRLCSGAKTIAVSKTHAVVSTSINDAIFCFNLNTGKEYVPEYIDSNVLDIQVHDGHIFMAAKDNEGGLNIIIFQRDSMNLLAEIEIEDTSFQGFTVNLEANTLLVYSQGNILISVYDLKKLCLKQKYKLKKASSMCLCSPNGDYVAAVSDSTLRIYNYLKSAVLHREDVGQTIRCIKFLSDNLIAIGGEKENIFILSINDKKVVLNWKAHESRIKSIAVINTNEESIKCLASASSDGYFKLWKLNLNDLGEEPPLVCEQDTECRITCLNVRHIPINWNDSATSFDSSKDSQSLEEKVTEKVDSKEDFCMKDCSPDEENDLTDDSKEKGKNISTSSKDGKCTMKSASSKRKRPKSACRKRKRHLVDEKSSDLDKKNVSDLSNARASKDTSCKIIKTKTGLAANTSHIDSLEKSVESTTTSIEQVDLVQKSKIKSNTKETSKVTNGKSKSKLSKKRKLRSKQTIPKTKFEISNNETALKDGNVGKSNSSKKKVNKYNESSVQKSPIQLLFEEYNVENIIQSSNNSDSKPKKKKKLLAKRRLANNNTKSLLNMSNKKESTTGAMSGNKLNKSKSIKKLTAIRKIVTNKDVNK